MHEIPGQGAWLKVPLRKLDTERMVPLDDDALAIVDRIAAKLPAAVLAELLNLSPGTAVRWMREAGGDWSRYAAQIAHSRNHQP